MMAASLNLRRIENGGEPFESLSQSLSWRVVASLDAESSSSEEEALSDVDESNIQNKKVIVLGAGIAGISAALFLKVGGHVWGDDVGNGDIEA